MTIQLANNTVFSCKLTLFIQLFTQLVSQPISCFQAISFSLPYLFCIVGKASVRK